MCIICYDLEQDSLDHLKDVIFDLSDEDLTFIALKIQTGLKNPDPAVSMLLRKTYLALMMEVNTRRNVRDVEGAE